MKRMISLLLAAALALAVLPACQEPAAPSGPVGRQPAASELVDAILPVSGYDGRPEELEYLTTEEDEAGFLTAYLENAYGLSEGSWQDAAVIRAAGTSAFELAVLRLENEDEAVRAAAAFMTYIFNRQGDFAGYAPEQMAMVVNGGIAQNGPYAALCICPEPDQATAAFAALIDGNPQTEPGQPGILPPDWGGGSEPTPWVEEFDPDYPDRYRFVQPNKDDMSIYDTSAIRTAWENGDPSSLSDYDKEIYHAAENVLGRILTDGMSGLQKETAVYSWIVNNVNYDWTHQDVMKETPRESFTPYGGLVNRTAVCLGYATTFQLLMDLAGVECITVAGASYFSLEDHGWNMVRLNGNWYCLDVTWDANNREYGVTRGREKDWVFFNITSDEMAATDHQWDYANTPEAVTAGNGRN